MGHAGYNLACINAPVLMECSKMSQNVFPDWYCIGDIIINKNIYPADKQDLKVDDEKSSAMGAMGLKPKIVH